MTSWRRFGISVAVVGFAVSALGQDILLEKGAPAKARKGTKPDHFTRWSPPSPEQLPPDAKIHIIQKGDTLWDLAQTYLGDPYFWPQLWEANRYIGDPHWIYPDDPLVIPRPQLIADATPPDSGLEIDTLPPPKPVAKRGDVYCAQFILPREGGPKKRVRTKLAPSYKEAKARMLTTAEEANANPWANRVDQQAAAAADPTPRQVAPTVVTPPSVISAEDRKIELHEGDVVWINRGEVDGVNPGDEFLVIHPVEPVMDPDDRTEIGIAMQMMGTLKVLCTQERTATAKITTSCNAIGVGDLIKALEPIPIPLASSFDPSPRQCVSLSDRAKGRIVYTKFGKLGVGTEDLVSIDMGSDQGIVPGDFLMVYRANRVADLPPVVLGDVVVLLVESKTSTVKVMSAYGDMQVGDKVTLR